MRKANEQEVVTQLIAAYQEEATLYASLEEAALEQFHILRNGHDEGRLDALTERQRQLAENIGRIEAGIAPLREYWEHVRDTPRAKAVSALSKDLDCLLERLAELIHQIVQIEKHNARVLMATVAPSGTQT